MPATTKSTTGGLTSAEAARRLRENGPNLLPAAGGTHPVVLLLKQFGHFFAILLWVAAALASVAGMPALSVAIALVVVLNGVFAFAQEYRADRAAQRLRDLMPTRATVRRDGEPRVVDAADLVVGDEVLLQGGDRVCADARVFQVAALAVDESMLSGESVPVHPAADDVVRAGTYVTEGEATVVVTATGAHTRLAGIASLTRDAVRPKSPLALRLHRVVTVVGLIAVAVGVAFYGVAMLLGLDPAEGFLFAVGVTVALVPEGLLPTVTLSLARAAQEMAHRKALVRRLDAVETLGATTFVCTDKTGTLTRNEMAAVRVWTPAGEVSVEGEGYAPTGRVTGGPDALAAVRRAAAGAVRCSPGARAEHRDGRWSPVGDPMEVALHVLAARVGADTSTPEATRFPFDPRRRRSSVADGDGVHVIGAPDAVLPLCAPTPGAREAVAELGARGLRVLAVAWRPGAAVDQADAERDLVLLGVVALQDPPRDDVADSIALCREAGIKLAMITGDHPATARAIAVQTGLLGPDGLVVEGGDLPADDHALGELLDRDGVVVARVTPEDKLRIARALQGRGHVVAMTGDGVNDGPALRAADIGVAMGASGTDVAREAADLVLLDDHFGTIVAAVELGRATFANIRRFLTYHLTDNVAELTPFVFWALSGGSYPLALSVLQVLALDIGTDLLPALALGAEKPNPRTMTGPARTGSLIDRSVLVRAFGVLGPAEALAAMAAFTLVLLAGDWDLGDPVLAATASGTAFTAIVLGQLANAFACRSATTPVKTLRGNRLLVGAVLFELVLLAVFLFVPPLPGLLGGSAPTPLGWALAATTIPVVLLVDAVQKWVRRRLT
ncbi:cation-translocating P-type ATPase [Saccharothrix violaceirubra]|uniref:Magnesium-transporting ATPase (P-type) n=1 Tax=Saccharothrix violaceirubra TaxID=413306 RepID=A0A7W7T5F2_9PSEU|nr:cation-transporting P-type ATPase [Saccharothrix violaceirubra]MBB4966929.1 magnesium-transporting ATPase (P-type) [Saccharothrix violaceirubra]